MDPISSMLVASFLIGSVPTNRLVGLGRAEIRPAIGGRRDPRGGCDFPSSVYSLPAGLLNQTEDLIAPDIVANLEPVDLKDRVCAEISAYKKLQDGWNGEGSTQPTGGSVDRAVKFVQGIPPGLPLPRPMLSPKSEIELYWDDPAAYVDVTFEDLGGLSIYSRSRIGELAEVFEDGIDEAAIDANWYFGALRMLLAQEKIVA